MRECGARMEMIPYLGDRREITDANELISLFGELAGSEAAARADRSRDLGNHIHFCRWRQIERLIVLMSVGRAVGTVH
jgi:hypothetical protein